VCKFFERNIKRELRIMNDMSRGGISEERMRERGEGGEQNDFFFGEFEKFERLFNT
jgi:hypothetical protein